MQESQTVVLARARTVLGVASRGAQRGSSVLRKFQLFLALRGMEHFLW